MTAPEAERTQAVDGETPKRIYAMSREGKRQAYILLLGVVGIWIFALWTLITLFEDGLSGVEWVTLLLMVAMLVVAPLVAWTLLEEASSRIDVGDDGVRYSSLGGINLSYKWSELSAPRGRERGRIARFFLGDTTEQDEVGKVTSAEDVTSRPEEDIASKSGGADEAQSEQAIEPGVGDETEQETILLRVPDRSDQVANALARLLHRQAHGPTLPVYGGLEDRDALLEEIARHVPELLISRPASNIPSTPGPASQPEIETLPPGV